VSYRCVPIFTRLPIPGYTPLIGARFGFGSRAGAAFESHSIDDLGLQLFVDPTNGVPRITSVKTNGIGGLTIIGTGSPGAQLALNATTNLASPANWSFRATVIPNGSGVFTFNEPNISTPPYRFYKLAAAPQLPTNLVTWWRAESNYLDSFGGNHGTSTNLSFVAGQRGRAFNFNGTNNAMTIGGSAIQIPWTAAFWVKRHDAIGASAALLADAFTGLKLEQAATPRRVGFTQFGVLDYSFNYTMPTNTWTHLTFVSRAGGTVLYTNGVVVETNAATINLPLGVMGALGGGAGDQLKALIDETTIFNRALTPAEIQQVINATRGP
jgi:hexosaminidase